MCAVELRRGVFRKGEMPQAVREVLRLKSLLILLVGREYDIISAR